MHCRKNLLYYLLTAQCRIRSVGLNIEMKDIGRIQSIDDLSGPKRLIERIEGEVRFHRLTGTPADDQSGEHIEDESNVDEALPSRYVGEINYPKLIRFPRREIPVD